MNFAFENLNEFMLMGKHGVYVWSCFAITIFGLMLLAWQLYQSRQVWLKQQRQRLLRESQL